MKTLRLAGAVLLLAPVFAPYEADAADGCGAGLYRDHDGRVPSVSSGAMDVVGRMLKTIHLSRLGRMLRADARHLNPLDLNCDLIAETLR